MNNISGYDVDELFEALENKLKQVKELREEGKELNRAVYHLNVLVFDLTEALGVDIDAETKRAKEILDYVHMRMLEDSENEETE